MFQNEVSKIGKWLDYRLNNYSCYRSIQDHIDESRQYVKHVRSLVNCIILCFLALFLFSINDFHRGNNVLEYGYDCNEIRSLLKENNLEKLLKLYPDIKVDLPVLHPEEWPSSFPVFKGRPLLNCMDYDEPYLLDAMRAEVIKPKIDNATDYTITEVDSSELKSQPRAKDLMEMVFKNQTAGRDYMDFFYLDIGTHDCEDSVSFPLEDQFEWKGLIVNPHPAFFSSCKKMNRYAYLLNIGIGTQNQPYYQDYDIWSAGPVTYEDGRKEKEKPGIASDLSSRFVSKMQSFPLASLILMKKDAHKRKVHNDIGYNNNKPIHFLSLDMSGHELAVLRTIPWDRVNVQVFSIKTEFAGQLQKDSSKEKIEALMENAGYTKFNHRQVKNELSWKRKGAYTMYVRNDIVKAYNVQQL